MLSILDLWLERDSGRYKVKIHCLTKAIEETVARLHLAAMGAKLTKLTVVQAAHLRVPVNGPFLPLRDRDHTVEAA